MTLFFVLSGFVIHYNYAGLVTAGGYAALPPFCGRASPAFIRSFC